MTLSLHDMMSLVYFQDIVVSCYMLFDREERFGEVAGGWWSRHIDVSRKRKEEEEDLRILLHSLQTCNGGLISKHVMYFTPTAGDIEGGRGGGWKETRDGGRGMAGRRRRSAYRLPSQQALSSPLFLLLPPPLPLYSSTLFRPGHKFPPYSKTSTSSSLPTHMH